jgi:predicted DNA-binding transcriptional regulator AlpA
MPEDLLDVEDAAAACRVPKSTLYRLRHEGEGPLCFRVGGRLKYPRHELELWMRDRIVDTAVGAGPSTFTGSISESSWWSLHDEVADDSDD